MKNGVQRRFAAHHTNDACFSDIRHRSQMLAKPIVIPAVPKARELAGFRYAAEYIAPCCLLRAKPSGDAGTG